VTVSRSQRLASLLRDELNRLLHRGIKDPRLEGTSVTRVDLSADCRNARVKFTCLGDQSGAPEAEKAFKRATGYLRGKLGRTLRLRQVPEMRFEFDNILHEATEVRLLIDKVVEVDRQRQVARGEFDEEDGDETEEESDDKTVED
jgi:ribosome-binding factor A